MRFFHYYLGLVGVVESFVTPMEKIFKSDICAKIDNRREKSVNKTALVALARTNIDKSGKIWNG